MAARDILLALAVAVLWGLNFVVMKHAVSEVPPLLLTGLRFALAALPAVFIVARPKVPWMTLVAYGAAFGIVKFGLLFTAFKIGGAAGLASVLLQTQVFFTIVLAQAVLGERVGLQQRIGIGIALVGVGAIIGGGIADAALAPVSLIVAAAIAWALANIIQKRAGPVDMLGFTVWMSLVPPLPMLAISAAVEGTAAWAQAWQQVSWLGVAAVLYLAYPISVGSGAAWGYLLARYPAASVAPFALLVPVIGVAGGALVFGERLGLVNLIGCVLILAGLATIVSAGRAWTPARRRDLFGRLPAAANAIWKPPRRD
jgi:O-acetylserine/cysteine efflux transporter